METRPDRKRILLKLSGEILLGQAPFGIDPDSLKKLAETLVKIQNQGVELAIVIGGGNIFRGAKLKNSGIEPTPADHMGLLSTMMNGIALERMIINVGGKSRAMSAIHCPTVIESYDWRLAMDLISLEHILIFVGGTGNPYFTTDSAAAMRASEMNADMLLKATKVDGIYSKDPLKYKDAKLYKTMTYGQILAEKLEVMDATAITLCRSNHIPIFVFNMAMLFSNSIQTILQEKNGTLVSGD